MRLLLPPLLISVDWFLKKCICVHSTADTALLFYTKWWNFAMLFRKNPKNSSEILQSVAKLVDFFYFLSDFQGIKMRNVSRETPCRNKKRFWCEMDEKTSRRQLRSSWLSSARWIVKEGKLPSLTKVLIRLYWNLKETKWTAVRHLENKKLQTNCNLRKIHKQFRQHNHRRTAQRQTAKRFCRTVRNWFSKSNVSHETLHKLKSFLIQQFFKNAGEVQGE